MARKTSDIALLLGSRGRSRSRKGGLVPKLVSFVDGLFGGSSKKRSLRETRTQKVSVWAFAAGVLLAFFGGFLIGGGVSASSPREDLLNANGGRKPGFVGEVRTTPLSSQAFIVAAYPDDADEVARQRATDLSRELTAAGVETAQPYLWPREGQAPLWVVAVYFDGQADAAAIRQRLWQLPADAGDQMFANFRIKQGEDWPKHFTIR